VATAAFGLAKLLLTRLQDLMPLAAYLRVLQREAGQAGQAGGQGAQRGGEGEGPGAGQAAA
jgi:hypothetical protein